MPSDLAGIAKVAAAAAAIMAVLVITAIWSAAASRVRASVRGWLDDLVGEMKAQLTAERSAAGGIIGRLRQENADLRNELTSGTAASGTAASGTAAPRRQPKGKK